jgi:hypothetical protein
MPLTIDGGVIHVPMPTREEVRRFSQQHKWAIAEDEFVDRWLARIKASGVELSVSTLPEECRKARQVFADLYEGRSAGRRNTDGPYQRACTPNTRFWRRGRR